MVPLTTPARWTLQSAPRPPVYPRCAACSAQTSPPTPGGRPCGSLAGAGGTATESACRLGCPGERPVRAWQARAGAACAPSTCCRQGRTRHDLPPPHFPRVEVCRDEALAHDGLQDLGQHALVVVPRILLEPGMCALLPWAQHAYRQNCCAAEPPFAPSSSLASTPGPPLTLSRWRTTTGSDTTIKALGPNASLNTGPLSRNLGGQPTWQSAAAPRRQPGTPPGKPQGSTGPCALTATSTCPVLTAPVPLYRPPFHHHPRCCSPLVQRLEQWLVARQVGELARSRRDVGAAHVWVEVALGDLG